MSEPAAPITPPASDEPAAHPKKHPFHIIAEIGCAILLLFIPLALLSAVRTGGIVVPMPNLGGTLVRTLVMGMAEYAQDHDGKYPDGHSSTEVFQQLLDGGYLQDTDYFFLPLRGKTQALNGQRLKPQNVCFDVTSGVTDDDPGDVPVVFITGCKVHYNPGGSAVPLATPFPPYVQPERSWSQFLGIATKREFDFKGEQGIYVCYKSGKTVLLPITSAPDHAIPDFVPPAFDSKGKTYTQLTPDGPLPQ